MEDVLSLKAIGCKGVIIGKAIYEGRITIEELSKLNQAL
jgi:phosphoribosylformimino-5-aminoimidazole carboxamide ribotide isomerase